MPEDQALSVRFIGQPTAVECGVTDMPRCVETIEYAFELHDTGRTLMGGETGMTHGQMLPWPEGSADPNMPPAGPDKRFAAMPAYVGGDVFKMGVKWYGSNVDNPAERGLPRSIHTITLNDPESGAPLAILDGTLISAMRTGAVAGVGAKHIQGDRAETAVVIGGGVIGRTSAMALDAGLDNLDRIEIFDIDRDKAESLSEELNEQLQATATAASSVESVVPEADVVVVAAAGATPPTIRAEWLADDALIIPLGDLDMPLSAIDDGNVFVDDVDNVLEFIDHLDWRMPNALGEALEAGDRSASDLRPIHSLMNDPNSESGAGISTGASTDGRSLFFALGLPIEDVAWASDVYRTAESEDLGQQLTLFEEAHWK